MFWRELIDNNVRFKPRFIQPDLKVSDMYSVRDVPKETRKLSYFSCYSMIFNSVKRSESASNFVPLSFLMLSFLSQSFFFYIPLYMCVYSFSTHYLKLDVFVCHTQFFLPTKC